VYERSVGVCGCVELHLMKGSEHSARGTGGNMAVATENGLREGRNVRDCERDEHVR